MHLTFGCALESPSNTRSQPSVPSNNYLPAPAYAAARQVDGTGNEGRARRVNVKLAGPAIGTSPHYLAYGVDLPRELTIGADFLWMDNGLWIGDQARGVKILEAPGLHRISVLVVTADGIEYRGAATVMVLDRGQNTSQAHSTFELPQGSPENIAATIPRSDSPASPLPVSPAQKDSTNSVGGTHSNALSSDDSSSKCDIGVLAKASGQATQIRIAVVDFQIGSKRDAEEGRALADLCRSTVADARAFTLLDRENMRTILGEQDFAAVMRCEITKCVVKYGKLLDAQKMIHGRVSRLGESQVVYLAVTDVETAEIELTEKRVIPGSLEASWPVIENMTCSLLRDMLTPRR